MDRRTFLGGVIAAFAASVAPLQAISATPSIWGDGEHDDTAGLQALMDSRPVNIVGDHVALMRSGRIELHGGLFRVSNTLTLGYGREMLVQPEARFIATETVDCLFYVRDWATLIYNSGRMTSGILAPA